RSDLTLGGVHVEILRYRRPRRSTSWLTCPAPEREAPVMRTVISIERFDGGLLELDGWGLASRFFTIDPSSVGMGSYDSLCGRRVKTRSRSLMLKLSTERCGRE